MIDHDFHDIEERLRVAGDQRFSGAVENVGRDKAQNVPDIVVGDRLTPECNDLIQQGLRVTHAALGCLDHIFKRAFADLDAFSLGDLLQVFEDFAGGDRPEDELLAA